MPKPAKEVFISVELGAYVSSLEINHKHRRWINEMAENLLQNILVGERIKQSQIPRHYIEKYNVSNLYRYAHSEGYRSTYTLTEFSEYGVCPVILDLISHKEYNRIFRYV
ncbi:hypothetical protein A3K69_06810 [Candidatus Bathyarchaeota archaeon RBG_16_57_9]|nr:MAG: hypothetical protein A3K69_06810 [Candidatus Bathyarchaeota archaeon RBG_16_57_9]OGD54438.1 MAG: hypothetical protein A3K81_06160 [Candidatus Bathyarchaeota archaeon RBG_13_60_20]